MRNHTLEVLGLELSFKAEADSERIERVRVFLEERYAAMFQQGGMVSKEKLLTFLALSLADDILQLRDEKSRTVEKLQEFLGDIEKVAE